MPLSPDPGLMRAQLERHLDEEARIRWATWRKSGTDVRVRFEPARAILFVRAHLQNATTGGFTYTAATSVSSTLVDCQETRVQDLTYTLDGVNQHWLFLIPIIEQGDGTRIKMDGTGGAPDLMFYLDMGV